MNLIGMQSPFNKVLLWALFMKQNSKFVLALACCVGILVFSCVFYNYFEIALISLAAHRFERDEFWIYLFWFFNYPCQQIFKIRNLTRPKPNRWVTKDISLNSKTEAILWKYNSVQVQIEIYHWTYLLI